MSLEIATDMLAKSFADLRTVDASQTSCSSLPDDSPKPTDSAVKNYLAKILEIKLQLETAEALQKYSGDIQDQKFYAYYTALTLIILSKCITRCEVGKASIEEGKNYFKIEDFE